MNIGVIGYGLRARHMVQVMLKEDPSCRLVAVVDPRREERDQDAGFRYYATVEDMLRDAHVDGIVIGTRCSLHVEMALKVLPTGIPLFLEKPVATTLSDLLRLKAAHEASDCPVVVSFPLRVTTIVNTVKEIVDSGKIGTVEHVQAINNVPYGGVYFHSWYRDPSLTGGLFLQKATHDFDYINAVLGASPVEVSAMTSKQVFRGDKPAGLKCVDCEENRTCPESTAFLPQADAWPHCCFAEDTGNEDSASALLRYPSGMHASYSQNFFARRGAGARGARFLGYKGTVEFDFTTGRIKVFMHHTPRVETYEFENDDGHFGGDNVLARNFIGMMAGKERPMSTLEDGLLSALSCLKATESAATGQFRAIGWDRL
ncbi:Gfo/Idh/MocA family protein [Cohnella hashimotonis]|uniref:Gfo/Idh/MocA family oxidoreductase n=1 Tax=Cohnella hashimotonis TaxID=2826895 RepID=A0ABT6TME7_9BACL|nr:Gfo/Idh/MocA family oxidoreductase [Cohnella hashimotonis]MDI4648021.1 Gfo/Idh/MocA family oxidoreductase [Cohnella hashimotonis]